MDAPELLTIPQVADELQVSRQTVYRIINDKQLKTVKVRCCHRVRRSALAKYLDQHEKRRSGNG